MRVKAEITFRTAASIPHRKLKEIAAAFMKIIAHIPGRSFEVIEQREEPNCLTIVMEDEEKEYEILKARIVDGRGFVGNIWKKGINLLSNVGVIVSLRKLEEPPAT